MIEVKNSFYIKALYTTLVVFLVVNLFYLMLGAWLALLPIVVQTSILVLLIRRVEFVKILIRIWAIVLLISGIFRLISSLATLALVAMGEESIDSISIYLNIVAIFLLGFSIYILLFLNKNITVIKNEETV
jgi:hypothetical protein